MFFAKWQKFPPYKIITGPTHSLPPKWWRDSKHGWALQFALQILSSLTSREHRVEGFLLNYLINLDGMRSWNERGPQNLRGPESRWPESSIKDLNRDSQYPIQTSRRTWNEVPRKKTRRWGPETRSSERKPVVRGAGRDATGGWNGVATGCPHSSEDPKFTAFRCIHTWW